MKVEYHSFPTHLKIMKELLLSTVTYENVVPVTLGTSISITILIMIIYNYISNDFFKIVHVRFWVRNREINIIENEICLQVLFSF